MLTPVRQTHKHTQTHTQRQRQSAKFNAVWQIENVAPIARTAIDYAAAGDAADIAADRDTRNSLS